MPLSWPDLPYKRGFNPIHWAITYPLFSAAILIGLAVIGMLSWIFARDFVAPGKFVVVEVYPVRSASASQDGRHSLS